MAHTSASSTLFLIIIILSTKFVTCNNVSEVWNDIIEEKTETTTDEEWLSYSTSDYEVFNVTEDTFGNASISEVSYNDTNERYQYKEYADRVTTERTLPILAICSDYLNISGNDYAYLNVTSETSLLTLSKDGAPCLQIKLAILIQVSFFRSKYLFQKWSAAFFPSLPDDNAIVTGECDDNDEAHVKIFWDEYALIWCFAKALDVKSWYLRSLEFFSSKSSWFTKYSFEDLKCWKFQYFSRTTLESSLDKPYKSCRQSVLKLSTEDSSLSVLVFLLKDKFQVQAFMKNESFFDDTLC